MLYATVNKEFTLEDASHFIVAFGLGRGFSCFVIGPLVQTVQVFSTHTWLALALLLQTIYFALDPWLTSYWLITGNAFVFGNAVSVSAILFDVVVKETFGKEQMGHVFGWTGSLAGVTFLLHLYFPGESLSIQPNSQFKDKILKDKCSHLLYIRREKRLLLSVRRFFICNCNNYLYNFIYNYKL